ncbi:XRE family transcriptional regulator [Staphylococcus caledonicus]|uniref:XRE family transcriptional regulator n=1 Tax=Staphylococcus caledonicus TaxID=2741333 RepID=UPI0018E406B6|nr:helix-turn-helix transcriptional regulator [Staphylococcus caledonicus]MBI5973411.1 helix-turn-helix domain-containing protein [Staphylococcus caledonicus]
MSKNKKNQLGFIIKKIRKSKNMTQEELSKEAGFSQNTISNHENGRRSIGENEVQRYAEALGVTTKYIYNQLDDINSKSYTEIKVHFGNLVKEVIESKNIDIDDLMKFSGISKPQLQSILNGYSGEIYANKILALCEYLNINPLYSYTNENLTENTFEDYQKARDMENEIEVNFAKLPFRSKEAVYNYFMFELNKLKDEE